MSNDSLEHLRMKAQAVEFCKKIGFKDEEIKVERGVYIKFDRNSDRCIIADVHAISKKKKVWIEVGDLAFYESDIKLIIKSGFEFYHFPYPKAQFTITTFNVEDLEKKLNEHPNRNIIRIKCYLTNDDMSMKENCNRLIKLTKSNTT